MSEFEAKVVSVKDDEVILDCTGFYPGGGGQVCDTGTINGMEVSDVHYEGKEIVHIVPDNDLKVGMRVWCSVDWNRRFDLMMGHTGEHLLFCSMLRQDPELEITKIFISPEEKYVVVNHDISWEKISAALEFANEAIKDNLTVSKSTMARDDPGLDDVRIKLDRIPEDEEITVVSIGDIDLSACRGIHVAETSELEMLFVDRKVSAGKEGTAIHFKVGRAAMDAAAGLAVTCLETCDEASSKPEDIVRAVVNMRESLQATEKAAKIVAKRRLSSLRPDKTGDVDVYSDMLAGADRKDLAEIAERVKSEGGVAAFVNVGENISVLLASGTDRIDCRKTLPEFLKRFGGRGGGKPDFAQGGIPDISKADEVFAELVRTVNDLLRSCRNPERQRLLSHIHTEI